MFVDGHRIHRIDTDVKFGGAEIKTAEASAPMAGAMKRDFPEVESTVRFRDRGELIIRSTETQKNTKGSNATYVDPSFFEFFGIQLLAGKEETALNNNISWWIFVIAGIGAIVITMITISFQAIKAAVANPVKSLRTE